MSSLRVVQHGTRVLLLADGKIVSEMPYQAAYTVAKALVSVGKLAEEWADAERIAMDEAILLRTGAPIGLSNNPRIIEEAKKTAAWDRDLRRYLPGGVKSKEVFGTPAIIQHPPQEA